MHRVLKCFPKRRRGLAAAFPNELQRLPNANEKGWVAIPQQSVKDLVIQAHPRPLLSPVPPPWRAHVRHVSTDQQVPGPPDLAQASPFVDEVLDEDHVGNETSKHSEGWNRHR